MLPIKGIEYYANKPDLFRVTSLTSMVENSTTTDLSLKSLVTSTLWSRFMYEKGFGM